MKAAWYERQGSPADVLVVGEMPAPEPGPGEVRIRVVASGINPGGVKKRQDAFGVGMPYPRVIPHSGGAGVIDEPLLRLGGAIAAYATAEPTPAIPFWPLLFKNVRLFLLGSDDFPAEAKLAAARALNDALDGGWPGFEIGARFPLESVAEAHKTVEEGETSGRVVLSLQAEEP